MRIERPSVLYVEGDAEVAALGQKVLTGHGYSVCIATTGTEGKQKFAESEFDAVLLDYSLPDIDGLSLAKLFITASSEIPVVFITGRGSEKVAAEALALGAAHYIVKESAETYFAVLPNVLHTVIEQSQVKKRLSDLQADLTASQERYTRALAGSNDGLFEWNIKTDEAHYSQQWLQIVGFEKKEFPFHRNAFRDLIHPDDLALLKDALIGHLENDQSYEVEYRLRHKQGHYVWVVSRAMVFRDENGEPHYLSGSLTDITDRKRSDAILRENEQRFRDFGDSVADYYWEMDETLTFSNFSDGFTATTNIPASEFLGAKRTEMNVPNVSGEDWRAHLAALAARRPFRDFVSSRISLNGETVWLSISGVPYFDERGIFKGYRGTGRNITEQKQIADALAESEARFKDFTMATSDYVWETDAEGRFTYLGEKHETVTGIDPKTLLGKTRAETREIYWDFELGENAQSLALMTAADKNREPYSNVGVTLRRASGQLSYVRVSGLPVFNSKKEFVGYRGTVRDETQQVIAANELLQSQHMMDNLLSRTREGFWHIDNDAITVDLNPAMCGILGRSREQIIGRSIFDFVDEENAGVFEKQVELRRQGKTGPYEIEVSRPDGSKIACVNNATPIYDTNENKTGAIGLWTDISEIKTTLEQLQEAKDQAESANRIKSEFLSSMSHELRTPMNAILGFAQLLQSNPRELLTEKQTISVDQVLKGGRHLLELIDQVLDLSKIESGVFDLQLEPFMPFEVFNECLELVSPLAEQRNISLSGAGGEPGLIFADRTRLRQILLNLLSNAIKYNKPGGDVRFGCGRADNSAVRVFVSDTGPGIPIERQGELFQPFNRIGRENSEIEGTGIGLTITKRLAEAMDGTVGFESRSGGGTTFWVDFPEFQTEDAPRIPGKDAPTPETDDGGPQGMILYIEDNPTNVTLMKQVFAQFEQLEFLSAPNAELGIEIAKGQQPDLILMDLNLRGIGGLEALRRLQSDIRTQGIPVLAVTASAMKSEITRGIKAGFSEYITKPINIKQVIETVTKYLSP